MELGILGLVLEGRFEPLQRLFGPLTQFRCHDDRQVEFLALVAIPYLELLQIRPCLVLVTQPGVGDGTVLISLGLLRGLLDDGIEVVNGLLALAKL